MSVAAGISALSVSAGAGFSAGLSVVVSAAGAAVGATALDDDLPFMATATIAHKATAMTVPKRRRTRSFMFFLSIRTRDYITIERVT
jgi:hypothetical protein